MKYLLDTSVYLQPLRANPFRPALERWQQVGFEDTSISVLTEAEVLSGLYLEGGEQRFHYYQNCLRDQVRVHPVDGNVSRVYARLKARLTRNGLPMAETKLMIAATALAHGLPMATLEPEVYRNIEGLRCEDWSLSQTGLPA